MESLRYVFADYMGYILAGVCVALVFALIRAVHGVWESGHRLRGDRRRGAPAAGSEPGKGRRVASLAGSVAWLFVCGALLYVAGNALASVGPELVAQRQLVGRQAPAVTYQRLDDGTTGRLSEHRGKVVVLNLWATWCGPCRKEMPDLDRLHRNYSDEGVVVVQVSNELPSTIRGYLDQNPMATEHGRVDPLPLPVAGFPSTYILDRKGVVQEVLVGSRDYEYFEAKVRPLL